MSEKQIVDAAVNAATLHDTERVQDMIAQAVGGRHQRPLGDRWGNLGLITAGGSFDHKVIENVTNMQDAVLELLALRKFGELSRVPYHTPEEAARDLLGNGDPRPVADRVTVEFRESNPPARQTKRLTVVCRDLGCGMTPSSVPSTIFALGSTHKEGLNWLQGAFGLGGETTFRNAKAIILVTRRVPELLLAGEEDRITVAVLLWERHGKTMSAYYLVTRSWEGPGDAVEPYSVLAAEYPDFQPGTHLTLVSYGVEGFHRARLGDERSFDTVLNTRLFEPMTPVRFTNTITRPDRREYLRGLRRRLEDNPRADRRGGEEVLPYNFNGTTYHLPIRYQLFSKRGEEGDRRRFVAYDHAVMFTSNGQVHYHWTPQEFKYKTNLKKLYDRILVVVETDELPIEVRTSLFTPDRSQLVRDDPAIRLEEQVAGFLNEWSELAAINNELIEEAVRGAPDQRTTFNIARQISRALKARGFSLAGAGGTAGGLGGGRVVVPKVKIDLYPDPTTLEGPEHVLCEAGKTRFITFICNAEDDFIPRRGRLRAVCDHPEITDREITVGRLRSGRVRVSVAVPVDAELGVYKLEVSITDWVRSSGGLGHPLRWITKFETVEERPVRRGGGTSGTGGAGEGPLVALIWSNPNQEDGWDTTTVGEVEAVPASTLARRSDYAELAPLGDAPVQTLFLNEEFRPLKDYVGGRARDLTDEGVDRVKERYAVGTGVGLLLLEEDVDRRRRADEAVSEEWIQSSQRAVARGVLSIMPAFDELAREAGLEQ